MYEITTDAIAEAAPNIIAKDLFSFFLINIAKVIVTAMNGIIVQNMSINQ